MNNNLLKLAGMIHKSAYYTDNEWLERAGVLPSLYPSHFKQTNHGRFYTTGLFKKQYQIHCSSVKNNWHCLGIPA